MILLGCSRDSESLNSATTIKYEVTSTSSFKTISGGLLTPYSLSITYLNESGGAQTEQLVVTGNIYTKTVNLQTKLRPIPIQYVVSGCTQDISGSVTIKIYVNNTLKGSATSSINNLSGVGYFLTNLNTTLE
jgi:hypothetical protein